MNLEQFTDIKQLLSEPKKIAIVSHRNPDGDAYGSSLALYHFLIKLDHEVHVVSPNDSPDFLKWLPSQNKITIFEKDEKKGRRILDSAEVVFVLDFNALHRVGTRMQQALESIQPIFIMIDHHQQPDDFAQFTYVDPLINSTCQMLYQFISKLDYLEMIDEQIATCLYTGILTDTGSFRFPSTTSKTHHIVANLIDKGANGSMIYNNIHDVNTFSRMQLLGRALKNMKVVNSCHMAYITLSQRELSHFSFKKGDTEGFVNYALSIKNVIFAAIFIEDKKQNIIKMSFRSVGSFSVNDFARKHFEGGGHINAAGGRSEDSLNDTVQRFLKVVPEYQKELNASYEK